MNFKRLSSLALCFMLVFAMATTATAASLLNDTWRIISGQSVGFSNGPFIEGSAFDAIIEVTRAGPAYMISINGGGILNFTFMTPTGPLPGAMWGGSGFTRVAPGEYTVIRTGTVYTYRVNGDFIEYRAARTPTEYMRLTLQRVSSIGTTPPPGGGGNGGGGGEGGGVGGGEGSGGGGGCNAGFGLFALGFVALSFFYRKRA